MYLLFGCLHIGQAKGVSGLSINILRECDKLSVQRGFFKYSAGAHPKASGQVAGWPLYLENQEIPGIYLHLEKHLENSIFGEIHLEIPGKMFSCCKKN